MKFPPLTPLILVAIAAMPAFAADSPGLNAVYKFQAPTKGNPPIVARTDSYINLITTGKIGPVAQYPYNYYSVIWTGSITAPTDGDYTFYMTANDNGRLWIGEDWASSLMTVGGSDTLTSSKVVALKAGIPTPILFKQWQDTGYSKAILEWSGPGFTRQLVPTTVLSTGGWTRVDAPSSSYESPVSAVIHHRPNVTPLISASPSAALASTIKTVGQTARWAEISLNQNAPVTVSVSALDQVANKVITWTPINFGATVPAEIDIRVGSKILVSARSGRQLYVSTGGYDRAPTSVTPVDGYYQLPFAAAGRYFIDDGLDVQNVAVNVIGIPTAIQLLEGGTLTRCVKEPCIIKKIDALPLSAVDRFKIGTFDHALVSESQFDSLTNSVNLPVAIFSSNGTVAYDYVRIKSNGSIMATVPIQGFDYGTTPALIDVTNPDGSKSGIARLDVYPFFRNVELTLTMRAHPTTFSDGKSSMAVRTDGLPTSAGDPGFTEETMPDGTKRGVLRFRVNFPPNQSIWCYTMTSLQFAP